MSFGRVAALCAAVTALTAPGASAQLSAARTFYVSPTGSDAAAGTTPLAPWRTVAKVNATTLGPGDTVRFQGGATFSDATLMPGDSGAPGLRITFGAYGAGRPRLTQGIWFSSVGSIGFEGLEVDGPHQGILASGSGSGARDVLIRDVYVHDVSIGINAANAADRDWMILASRIDDTGDSGLILTGSGHTVGQSTITDTGTNASIAYGKHGIYLKASGARVTGNTIRSFSANGVSARRRDGLIAGNTIEDGPIGIAWFQEDPTAGTSRWLDNVIRGTTAAGIYVSASDAAGATRESFVIAGNVLDPAAGGHMDLRPTSGTYTVQGNAEL